MTLASKKTGVEKAYLFIGITLLPVFILFFVGAGHFIIDLVGFVYPLYASMKAIETTGKDDDTQWLVYWIIFALFKVVEGVADVLISFIPFYYLGKCAFLVWCYHPNSLGAMIVYQSVLKPYIVPLVMSEDAKKSD